MRSIAARVSSSWRQRVLGAVHPQHRHREGGPCRDRVYRRRHGLERGAPERPVPDERIVRVGTADLRVARQGPRIDGHVRQRVHREEHLESAGASDRGSGEHERRQALAMPLREARRHDAPHRVSDEDEGPSRMLGRRGADRGAEIRDQVVDVLDEGPLAIREPVAQVVGGVDRRTVVDQMLRHVIVAGRMLAISVRDQRDIAWLRGWPGVQHDAST